MIITFIIFLLKVSTSSVAIFIFMFLPFLNFYLLHSNVYRRSNNVVSRQLLNRRAASYVQKIMMYLPIAKPALSAHQGKVSKEMKFGEEFRSR